RPRTCRRAGKRYDLIPPISQFFFCCSADPPHLHSFPTRRSSDLDPIAPHQGLLSRSKDSGLIGSRSEATQGFSAGGGTGGESLRDRKSTRLNSSHRTISYAVFCLKKKKTMNRPPSLHPQILSYAY